MISILTPSRGRPKLAKRMYDTAMDTVSSPQKLQILFYLNNDDETLKDYQSFLPEDSIIVGPDQSTSYSWNNDLLPRAKHEIIFLAGDDVQFKTAHWDKKITDVFDSYDDKICMVVPWDGKTKDWQNQLPDKPVVEVPKGIRVGSPHFALHKNWINTLGYFLPPWFWHWYVDTYNQKIANELGRLVFLPHTLVKAKKIFDDTAVKVRKNLNINHRDDYVWSKVRDRHLQADVEELKKFIDGFQK